MRTHIPIVLLVGACSSDAKEDLLNDIDANPGDSAVEVTNTTTDSDEPDDDTTTNPTGDVVVDDSTTTVVDSVTPTELPSGSDATIPDNALEGFGWLIRLSGLTIAAPAAFDTANGKAIAVPTRNGTAAELRTWNDDGSPRWSSTIYIGTQPTLAGVAFCNDRLTVTGGEVGDAKAFVARLDANATNLERVALSANPEVVGDKRSLSAPSCGGPGTYAVLNGRQLIDLSGVLAVGTPLPTVSSDKIDIVFARTANATDEKVFYLGQVNEPKTLGDNTLQIGDQLIYARDYVSDVGGTATGTGYFGSNDVTHIAPAADGRFAVVWNADVLEGADEQRVTSFDAEGKQVGTLVIAMSSPVRDARWVGNELVLAGTFDGAPPFPTVGAFASGVWIAVVTPGSAMAVVRSTTFMGGWDLMGLHEVDMHGDDCPDAGWGVLTQQSGGVAVVALGSDGSSCHSAPLEDDDSDAPLDGASYALELTSGEYVFATKDFLRLVRLRVGYAGLVP